MAPLTAFRLLQILKFYRGLGIPSSNQDNLIAKLRVKEQSTTENTKVKGISNTELYQLYKYVFDSNNETFNISVTCMSEYLVTNSLKLQKRKIPTILL